MNTRDDIALEYCRGSGVELGPGMGPTKVAPGTRIFYVDKRSEEELKQYFGAQEVVVGQHLETFEKGNFDFLMAHHVLEHCSNVIDTLILWMSYLKENGTLFLSVPNRETCGDRSRLITTPTHFLSDYVLGVTDSSFESREHIYSFLWGWHEEGGLRGKTKQESHDLVRAAAHQSENDLHWHVFTIDTFKAVLRVASGLAGRRIEFTYEEDGRGNGSEHRIVAHLALEKHVDDDVAYLADLRRHLPLRLAQIALKHLDGLPVHSYSKADVGKIFVAQNQQLRWVREAPILAEMGLADKEPVYMEVESLDQVYGPDIASLTFAVAQDRAMAVLDRIPLRSGRGIELSPGAHPIVSKANANVIYCDNVGPADWKKSYGEDTLLKLDNIFGNRLLDEVFDGEKFDYIVSSHVLEHMPDFIQFFVAARKILRDGGKIVKLVPDRRFTFDVLRKNSTIDEIEAAHKEGLRRPSISMLEDFYLNVDLKATAEGLWRREYDPQPSYAPDQVRDIFDQLDLNNADTHCWTFTPESFRGLIDHVISHYVPNLRVVEISDTPRGSNEFLVHLRAE